MVREGRVLVLWVGWLGLVLAACAPVAARTPSATLAATSSPAATVAPSVTPTPVATGRSGSSPTASVPQGAEKMVNLAKDDLARQKGVAVDQITVVRVEEKEWSDTSLGCPEPGKMYAQVVTPGYLVILSHGGQTYEYHTDRSRNVVLCQKKSS